MYLEDIIIFSRNIQSPFGHVKSVLFALDKANMSVKLSQFLTRSMKYLGHVIRPGTLEVDEIATPALQRLQPPTIQSELRSFLG